jgi:hypothetical protein
MFVDPTAGYLGDEGRNELRAPGLADWDFSLVKDTKVGRLGEAGAVEFRAEVFNLLNHPNFALPATALSVFNGSNASFPSTCTAAGCTNGTTTNFDPVLATTGVITTPTATPARQIQFALKVLW